MSYKHADVNVETSGKIDICNLFVVVSLSLSLSLSLPPLSLSCKKMRIQKLKQIKANKHHPFSLKI